MTFAPTKNRQEFEALLGPPSQPAQSSTLPSVEEWRAPDAEEMAALWKGHRGKRVVIDAKYLVQATTTEITCRRLPFYDDNVLLFRIFDSRWGNPALAIYHLLMNKNAWYRLNGISPPIHEVNAKAPVRVTEQNVLHYLEFFCFFVRSADNPFYILGDSGGARDAKLPPNAWEHRSVQNGNASLADLVRPSVYHGITEGGKFRCSALILFGNGAFLADFEVQPTGMIEMIRDEPLLSDLPGQIDAPLK